MNKNDAAAVILAQLIGSHLYHDRIAHWDIDKKITLLAQLAVLAAEKLDKAIEFRNDDLSGFTRAVLDSWLIET